MRVQGQVPALMGAPGHSDTQPRGLTESEASAPATATVAEKSEWTGEVPEAGQAGTGFIFTTGRD